MSKLGLTRLTGISGGSGNSTCDDNDCPNVYATDRGTFVIQGSAFTGFAAPAGETLTEIPEEVLREAVRVLGW
jgi:hypothetical protein